MSVEQRTLEIEAIVALEPDLVVVDVQENRLEDFAR